MTTALPDDEPDVRVCRSKLGGDVWFCYSLDGSAGDLTDWEHPGRLRTVQRYAADVHGDGQSVRWERVDEDTWRMRVAGGLAILR